MEFEAVLAFDPGTREMGWAIVSKELIHNAGVIKSADADLGMRFVSLSNALQPVFDEAQERGCILVGIEKYMSRSSLATDAVKGLIGIIRLMCAQRDMPAREVYPNQVKRIVAGRGNAEKADVAASIMQRFPHSKFIANHNTTDAIAIGLTLHALLDEEKSRLEDLRSLINRHNGCLSNKTIVKAGIAKDVYDASDMVHTLAVMYEHSKDKVGRHIFDIPWRRRS
jgi:Holliday junction resolvasome RuvABC endonuclease subunit